jgi:hypothetical protein
MLQLADLAKFAKYRPLADENDRSMDVAKEFVTRTIPMEKKVDLITTRPKAKCQTV